MIPTNTRLRDPLRVNTKQSNLQEVNEQRQNKSQKEGADAFRNEWSWWFLISIKNIEFQKVERKIIW